MASQREEQHYRRKGNTAKCPACGEPMDPEAYRCPKCKIYFCFKCRRRVQPRDEQFQCMNQKCGYYGKLLCNACVVEVPTYGEESWPELVPGETKASGIPLVAVACVFVAITLLGFGSGLYFDWKDRALNETWIMAWCLAIIAGVVGAGVSAFLIKEFPREVDPVYRNVPLTVEVGRSKCCIACREAVEHLR